jgi:leucyl aminopeptidase (aminopeptidase T)
MPTRPRLKGSTPLTIDGMEGAAQAAVRCLGVGPEDDVLVLCNKEQRAIAEALAAAAEGPGRSARIVVYQTLSRDGEELPADVAEVIGEADVVFAPTTFSISHTRARMQATSRGVRIATMPAITEAVFARALPVDYMELRRVGARIAAELGRASTCRVTSAAGTDIVLSLEGRAAEIDDGNLQATGAFGNLPAGETYIAPVEGSAEGLVVFDGSLAGYGLLDDPVRVKVTGGRAVEADGVAGRWLLNTLDASGASGRVLAELGIGTNPAATLSGNILEDEKVIGTAHLAFGTNVSFGGANASTVHIDGMLLEPTVELDGRPLVGDGELLDPKD